MNRFNKKKILALQLHREKTNQLISTELPDDVTEDDGFVACCSSTGTAQPSMTDDADVFARNLTEARVLCNMSAS